MFNENDIKLMKDTIEAQLGKLELDYCKAYGTLDLPKSEEGVLALDKLVDTQNLIYKIEGKPETATRETILNELDYFEGLRDERRYHIDSGIFANGLKMNYENRLAIFEFEIKLIKSGYIRGIVKNELKYTPNYFFYVPASSSGRYHPDYAQGAGGLVRHTIAAVKTAVELMRLEQYADELNQQRDTIKDEIIAALILHDTYKCGLEDIDAGKFESYKTKSNHPVLAHDQLLKHQISGNNKARMSALTESIADLILTHMGQWNTDRDTGEEIMPKPETFAQKFVHMCDYIASRKNIEVCVYNPKAYSNR